MRTIVSSYSLVFVASISGAALAQGQAPVEPSTPAPAPVVLPETPEAAPASAPSGTASSGAPAAPAPAPNRVPGAPATVPAAPPVGAGSSLPPLVSSPNPPVEPVHDTAPPPRGPVTSRFNVAVNIDTVWYTGPSFDLFSDHNNATSPGVSIGYAVLFDEPLSIVPEIGWSTNTVSASGLFGGSIPRTELATQTAYASLSLRYGLISILDVHGRIGGGASFLDATIQTAGALGELQDKGSSPFGTLGAGITVHTPAGTLETKSGALRTVVAGITVEGGYVLGGSVDLAPTPTGDVGRIPTSYMPLGTLERSGPYLRTALNVRF